MLDQMDLIDIYRIFHLKAAEYILPTAHRTFSKIDHMLEHKINLNKFKKIETISSIFLAAERKKERRSLYPLQQHG